MIEREIRMEQVRLEHFDKQKDEEGKYPEKLFYMTIVGEVLFLNYLNTNQPLPEKYFVGYDSSGFFPVLK